MKIILLISILGLIFSKETTEIHDQVLNFCNAFAKNIARIRFEDLERTFPPVLGQQVKSVKIENFMDMKCDQGEYLISIQAREISVEIELKGVSSITEKIKILNPKIQGLLFSDQVHGIFEIKVLNIDLEGLQYNSWFIDQFLKMNGVVKEGIRYMAKAKQNEIRELINKQIRTKFSIYVKQIFNFISKEQNPEKWIEKILQTVPSVKKNGQDLIIQLSKFRIDDL